MRRWRKFAKLEDKRIVYMFNKYQNFCTNFKVKEASSRRNLPLILKAFRISPSNFCFCFFPADAICEPFNNSTEISKSPHLVNRLDTNDPNGSTVAPVPKIE